MFVVDVEVLESEYLITNDDSIHEEGLFVCTEAAKG